MTARHDNVAEIERLIETDPATALARASSMAAAIPADPDAYRLLASSLRRLGRADEAARADLAGVKASAADPEVAQAGKAILTNDLPTAERLCRAVLERRPNDASATRMLGEVALGVGALRDAEALFRRTLELAPALDYARLNLGEVLLQQSRPADALAELDQLGSEFAGYSEAKTFRASALGMLGEYQRAIDLYREIIASEPVNLQAWTSLAFMLKTVGEPEAAVEACRSALKAYPADGEAWWMLADMKTYRFNDAEVTRLEAAIADPQMRDDDRLRLHMVLGKALEDRTDYHLSFEHYRIANAMRAAQRPFDPLQMAQVIDRTEKLFTAEFFESRAGSGDPVPDPIFIVGLPRSGSTLLEQILASHPMIEGTAELSDLHALAGSLEPGSQFRGPWQAYPDNLADLSPDRLAELGHRYLASTRVQRKTDRSLFIDKMPNNWLHAGFIRLILPNAKIIDARRHPLACGFSNFKQLYARGHEFSYDLAHIGEHYRQYQRLMAHFDRVAPGLVLRVIHEAVVADPETQIRRMLDYVGVPFDEACVHFHDTKRAVRSASAEQVRRPIQADATEQWRAYEAHLGPLKAALGPTLDNWQDEA
jgi:tetratricopeptide (TPR) repeat protein